MKEERQQFNMEIYAVNQSSAKRPNLIPEPEPEPEPEPVIDGAGT